MLQDQYRARPGLDPVGADAEAPRRLHEDARREDERRPGRLLRYYFLILNKMAGNLKSKLNVRSDLPAYSDTVYSDTPLTVTLLACPN